MRSHETNITPAELRVLKALWDLGEATVRDVKDRLVDEGEGVPAYTTVMTLMNQLAAKGALDVDRSRQPFLYRPLVRREQVLGQRLKQFLQTVFDGQAGELVLRLIDEVPLTAADVKRIERRIEEIDQATVDDHKSGQCAGDAKGDSRTIEKRRRP